MRRAVSLHIRIPDPDLKAVFVCHCAGVLQHVERVVFHDGGTSLIVCRRGQEFNGACAEQRQIADILMVGFFCPRDVGVGFVPVADLTAAQLFARMRPAGGILHRKTALVPVCFAEQMTCAVNQAGAVVSFDGDHAVCRVVGKPLRRGRLCLTDRQFNAAFAGRDQGKIKTCPLVEFFLKNFCCEGRVTVCLVIADGAAFEFRRLHRSYLAFPAHGAPSDAVMVSQKRPAVK